jgi:transposase
MEILYRRCAGLDIQQKSIAVCVRIVKGHCREPEVHTATFGTFTEDLELRESANIKLASVLSNIVGKTGRSILDALATATLGRPESFAALATHKRVRSKQAELRKALNCERSEHFHFLLSELLGELDWLDAKLALLERRIEERMRPYADLLGRLCRIPGVRILTAWAVIAEIGIDMSRFSDAAHFASWAGLCPGNSESAGKRHSGRTRKGNCYLRAAARTHDSFLSAVFFRIARTSGLKKAAIAVAHRLLIIIYSMLRDGTEEVMA